MIEQSLFQSNFVGRDGFKWWIGQVADPESSGWSKSATLIEKEDAHYYRVKVRILGYHPTRDKLPDADLPFAHVLVPLGQGTGTGWIGETHDIQGGESVLGFFADGDDCQQPIIFGAFYRSKDQPDETFATGEDPTFKRFTGKKSITNTSQNQLLPALESSKGTNVATGEQSPEKEPEALPPGLPTQVSKALKVHSEISNVTVTPPNPCENNDISRIQTTLNDFMKRMKQTQSFLDNYVNPSFDTLVNLDSEIKKYTYIILGIISNQVEKAKDYLLTELSKEISSITNSTVPKSQQPIVGEAQKTILDLIYCLFEKLLKELFDLIFNLLSNLLSQLFDVVQCLVDNFLNDIFESIDKFVSDNISPLLEQINSLFGGKLQNINGILSKALSFTDKLLDLLTECNPECPSPSSWTASNGTQFGLFDDFSNLISQLDGKSFGPCDTSLICSTDISIFGGGGTGAVVDLIIGGGQILGVDIIDGGSGYTSEPTISITDNCGGYGGELESIIDPETGDITDIVVIDPGDGYNDTDNEDPTVIIDDETGGAGISTTGTQISPKTKCGFISGVIVKSIGENYSSKDTVTVLDLNGNPVPEVKINLVFGPNNSIIGAEVTSSTIFCGYLPTLVINTSTGFGAVLKASMKYRGIVLKDSKDSQTISIIDCVSK